MMEIFVVTSGNVSHSRDMKLKYNIRDGIIRFAPGDAVVTPMGEREIVVLCDLHGCTLASGERYAPERLEPSAITPDQISSLSQLGYRVTGEYKRKVWLNGNGEDVMTTVSYLPKFIAEMTNPQPPTPITMKQDIELYAHVTRSADGFELHIGREVTGKQSHGAATWVGTFGASVDAIRYAQRRGVYSSRIAVDVPEFRVVRTVDGGTVLKRVS